MTGSRHLVDPELLAMLDNMPELRLSAALLPLVRRLFVQHLAEAPARDDLAASVHEIAVPAAAGDPLVRLLAYRPINHDGVLPAMLHIHGGGYVIGTPEIDDLENRRLAVELGCAIFSVDYRLAPETPHPGPVEDCYAALAWLHDNASRLRIDPQRLGVKGESAGGGLAACLALLARDRGTLPVAFQHLTYPMLDDRTCTRTDRHPLAGEFVWTPTLNLFGWSALLAGPPGGDAVSCYAAASRAIDLQGLPPCFMSVGALDLFLEEDLEFARRLTRAGVATELHVHPGAFHFFDRQTDARVSIAAERTSRAALRRMLHP